ncbi:hypothetical protein [Proteus mirabilis]|uniref:hypothetical protein n=1 Tax=Proteus mirabilis TaxID=584 RepID=UPI0034D702B6
MSKENLPFSDLSHLEDKIKNLKNAEVSLTVHGTNENIRNVLVTRTEFSIDSIQDLDDFCNRLNNKIINILRNSKVLIKGTEIFDQEQANRELTTMQGPLTIDCKVYDVDNNDNLTSIVLFTLTTTLRKDVKWVF